MARGAVRIFNGKFANVQGAAEVEAMLAAIPETLSGPVQAALDQGAADIVSTFKAAAPVAPEFERHPGQLRDSAHVERDNGRALSVTVVVDARDEEGRPYPAHVEYGHRTTAGTHVAARPAFWPAVRVNRRKIKNSLARAVRRGVKAVAGDKS